MFIVVRRKVCKFFKYKAVEANFIFDCLKKLGFSFTLALYYLATTSIHTLTLGHFHLPTSTLFIYRVNTSHPKE